MRRFEPALARVQRASERVPAIRGLTAVEVIGAAVTAAARGDAYLANVLATEAMNRVRRLLALVAALSVSLAIAVGTRLAALLFFDAPWPQTVFLTVSTAAIAVVGGVAYAAWVRTGRVLGRGYEKF